MVPFLAISLQIINDRKHAMKKTLFATFYAVLVGAVFIGCAAVTPATPEVDVFNRYARALNAGNLEQVMVLVADDAAFDNPGRCKPNPCRGKPVLEAFIKETVMDVGGQLKVIDVKSAPGTVDARVEFTSQKVKASGIERIVGNERWKIANGKITVFEFAIETQDVQSMAYIKSLQHAAAQAAAQRAQPATPTKAP